jgi:hypothetical protein
VADERAFGIPDGIEKRLAYWSRQLSMDKRYPWVGTGLIDDLKCAATLLGNGGDGSEPLPAKVEYDL